MSPGNSSRSSRLRGRYYETVILVALCIFVFGSCGKRKIKSFYEAYYNAMVWPEDFDSYVQNHEFDKDFFSCLGDARGKISKIIEERAEICEMHIDPEWRQQCYDEIDEVALLYAINSIEAVVRNGTPFEETATGFALLLAKQILGEQSYEQLQMQTVPTLEEHFVCKRRKKFLFF